MSDKQCGGLHGVATDGLRGVEWSWLRWRVHEQQRSGALVDDPRHCGGRANRHWRPHPRRDSHPPQEQTLRLVTTGDS